MHGRDTPAPWPLSPTHKQTDSEGVCSQPGTHPLTPKTAASEIHSNNAVSVTFGLFKDCFCQLLIDNRDARKL